MDAKLRMSGRWLALVEEKFCLFYFVVFLGTIFAFETSFNEAGFI